MEKMENNTQEYYSEDHTVGLVTNASYINQNLALLCNEDYYKADSLAVAHEGFISYIPLVNTMRRCKYVPICVGCDRGKGMVKWMKWIKMGNDTYLVCLSTIGIQFFDVELTDVQFEYDFKELNSRLSLPLGACLLGDNTLYVGTAMGMVAMFKSTNEVIRMVDHLKLSPFMYMDGYGDCLVTISREELKSYRIKDGTFKLAAEMRETLILYSVMKVFKEILLIGHHSGELSLMILPRLELSLKSKIHEGEITGVDYSIEKKIILTVSDDLFIKAWKLDHISMKLECIFKHQSKVKPFCGVGFTNINCTEFCCVVSNALTVVFFVEKSQKMDEDSNDESYSEAESL